MAPRPPRSLRRRRLMLVLLGALPLAGAVGKSVSAWLAPSPRTITVLAAASLREVFVSLGAAFEAKHPGVKVRTTFAGSQELRSQIEHGASADVFAAADLEQFRGLGKSVLGTAEVFAQNEVVLVVPRGNPGAIRDLPDLGGPRPETSRPRLVVGDPAGPLGRYTIQLFDRAETLLGPGTKARILDLVRSREPNTRQVLAKVASGDADAAFVYRTDVAAADGKVQIVPLPPELIVKADYGIAVLAESREPELARAFVDQLRSQMGHEALRGMGFEPTSP